MPQTREKLLDCAGKIIAKKGYQATTSKEICETAGLDAFVVKS